MATTLNEYRCTRTMTRRDLPEPLCSNLSNRNVHYIVASGPFEAFKKMENRFPDDVKAARIGGYIPFTLQVWKAQV